MTVKERQGWMIVLTMSLSMFLLWAGAATTLGIFFIPMSRDFHVSRAKLSVSTVLTNLLGGLLAPAVGWLLEHIDARAVVGAGVAISILALLASSRAHTYEFLLITMCITGLGYSLTSNVPIGTLGSNWFSNHRGLALALMWLGVSLGGSVQIQVANYLVYHYGWRTARVLMTLPVVVVVLPMVLRYVRTRPAVEVDPRSNQRVQLPIPGLELKEAFDGRTFWLMALMAVIFQLVHSAVLIHAVPHLISLGLNHTQAAVIISTFLLVSSVSKPLMGALADRIGPKVAVMMLLTGMTLGVVALLKGNQPLFAGMFIVCYGIGSGPLAPMLTMLAAELFGLRRYATLFGIITAFSAVAQSGSVVLAGRVYDLYGSYRPAFVSFAILLAIAATLPFACISFRAQPTVGQEEVPAAAS